MATIRIRNRRRDEQAIPDLCARCGQPTTYRKTKEFSSYPSWVGVLILVGVLPYLIVALILAKKRIVELPLCEQHRHHFLWPPVIFLGGFVLIVTLGITLGVIAEEFTPPGTAPRDGVLGYACLGWMGCLMIWLIAAIIAQGRVIKAKEITDDEIVLVGVAEEFVDAFEDELEARRASRLDREAEERWSEGRSERGRGDDERDRKRYRREDDEEEDDRERYSGRRLRRGPEVFSIFRATRESLAWIGHLSQCRRDEEKRKQLTIPFAL